MAENFDEKNPKLFLLKKIQSNEHILKEMPPPLTSSTWQPVSQWDDDKDFSQMSQLELDDATQNHCPALHVCMHLGTYPQQEVQPKRARKIYHSGINQRTGIYFK